MKAAIRALKNHAYSYADVEVKVREATSNDPWSCPPSLLRELSRATHDYQDYPKLFAMLWKRLADVEHVMHVSKALSLLHFLLLHGSERFVLDVKRRARDVSALTKYKHYNADNIDDAKEARVKAKAVFELLSNEQRLSTERGQAEQRRTLAGEHADAFTAEEEEEEERYRQRKRQQAASTVTDDADDADDADREEKRSHAAPVAARARATKPKAGSAKAQQQPQPRSAATAAGDEFTAVSEEEMADGAEEEKDGGRVRTVRRTVRSTKTESVREGDEDERVKRRDERREETLSTTRQTKAGQSPTTTTAVRGSRSSLQPDGSTATSHYADVASTADHSPIPLLDDLALLSAAAPGGRPRGAGSRGSGSRPARGAVDDVEPVTGELDLLSLASRPNVYYVPSNQQAAELDMLTGTQPQPVASTSAAGSRQQKARPQQRQPTSAATAPQQEPRRAAGGSARPAAASALSTRSSTAASSLSAKKRALLAQLAALEGEGTADEEQYDAAQEDAPLDYGEDDAEDAPVPAPAPRPQPQSAARGGARRRPVEAPSRAAAGQQRQAIAQPSQYDEGYGVEEGEQQEEEEEPALLDRLPAATAQSSSPAVRNAPGVGATGGAARAGKQSVSRAAPLPAVDAVDVWEQSELMDLDHLQDNVHATPRATAAARAGGKAPRRTANAAPALSMAEMQSASTFPSVSSLAMSDESLTNAFARRSQPSGTTQFSGLGFGPPETQAAPVQQRSGSRPQPGRTALSTASASAQRNRPAPASTDIFFQS